jgi:crossover junction endodeoxyribonuclease RuvC
MRIIGIDPGLASTGYGIVDVDRSRMRHVCHGVVRTASEEHNQARLARIYATLQGIVETHKPEAAGVESLYFAKNATSAIPVAQARGVVLLLLAHAGIDAVEYAPQQIKQSIVGRGRAEKHQVQELVRLLLGLEAIPEPDHAADALAAAICFHHNAAVPKALKQDVRRA